MALYIWQNDDWPLFTVDVDTISPLLAEINHKRGLLAGRMVMVGLEHRDSLLIDAISNEIIDSAEIEGQNLNRDSVRSSVAQSLGIKYEGIPVQSRFVDGVVHIMLDATHNHATPLTATRLKGWHAALFPTGHSGPYPITVAQWRQGDAPMQVVSGAFGSEKVHFEAPPSTDVDRMMADFLEWVETCHNSDPVVKAAIAHLWFVTIHPFDDGNGRLCRTITELLLARADSTAHRYYSLSSEILRHRNGYYDALERAQKGGLNVTEWVQWFISMLGNALDTALLATNAIVEKTKFWDRNSNIPINERQRKIINRLLGNFDGNLSTTKYAKICHCSQDTAARDINDLIAKNLLIAIGAGRSTRYRLLHSEP